MFRKGIPVNLIFDFRSVINVQQKQFYTSFINLFFIFVLATDTMDKQLQIVSAFAPEVDVMIYNSGIDQNNATQIIDTNYSVCISYLIDNIELQRINEQFL